MVDEYWISRRYEIMLGEKKYMVNETFRECLKTKTPSRNRRDHLYGWVSKYRKL